MALPPEYAMGLVMYGLDTVEMSDRKDVWCVLAPHLPAIADAALDAYIQILPFLAAQIRSDRAYRRDLIVKGTEALFINPYDEAWLARVIERVDCEAANRGDTRTRMATNMWIIKELNAKLASRRFLGASRRLRLIDVATRMLMHDASLATSLHHARLVRNSETINAELTKAFGVFDHVTKDILNTVVERASFLRVTAKELLKTYEGTVEHANTAAAAAASTASHVTCAATETESFSNVVEDLSRISAMCARGAQDAYAHMSAVNATSVALSTAVEGIGPVVEVIANLAKHTDLLALNATIEAARAGVAGRGFTVVATEVKSLAAETSMATRRIKELIGSVQAATSGTIAEMATADERVDAIAMGSKRLAEAVDAQTKTAENLAKEAIATVADAAVAKKAAMSVTESLHLTRDATSAMSRLSEDLDAQMQTLHSALSAFFKVVDKQAGFQPLPKIMSSHG